MLYTQQTTGTVGDVAERVGQAAKDHKFGVLGTIDLRAKMAEKGVTFDRDCVIVEVCNPHQAKKVLDQNISISTSLPCRISVYEQAGEVTIETVRPTMLLEMYRGSESLADVATQVEDTLIAIIDQAAGKAT